MLHYDIEVRDKDGKMFVRPDGCKVTNCFKYQDNKELPEVIESKCRQMYMNYSTISGSPNVNIYVFAYNSISDTYMSLYSFYGKEQRFVKHS